MHCKPNCATQAVRLILRIGQSPTGLASSSRLPDEVASVSAALAALAVEPAAAFSAAAVRASAPFFVFVAGGAVPSAVFAPRSDAAPHAGAPGPAAAAPADVPAPVSDTSSPAAVGISDRPLRFRYSADGPGGWPLELRWGARSLDGFRRFHDFRSHWAVGRCDFPVALPDDSFLARGLLLAAGSR